MARLTAALLLTGHQCDSQHSPGKSLLPTHRLAWALALCAHPGCRTGTVEVSAWRADMGEHGDNSCRVHGCRPSSFPCQRQESLEGEVSSSTPSHDFRRVRRTTRLRCPIWGTSRRPLETSRGGLGPPALRPGHTPGSTRPRPWDQTRGGGASCWLGLHCIVTERQLDDQGERNMTRMGSGPALGTQAARCHSQPTQHSQAVGCSP